MKPWKFVSLVLALTAVAAQAIQPGASAFPPKLREAIAHLDLQRYEVVPQPAATKNAGFDRLQRLYPGKRTVQVDARVPIPLIIQGEGIPWIPGSGNQLPARERLRPEDLAAIANDFTARNQELLGIAPASLQFDRKSVAHFGRNNRYWSLRLHQVVRNAALGVVPVRDAHLFFRVNHGNLIQFGNYLAVPPQGLSFVGIISRAEAVQRALALVDDLGHVKVTDAAIDLGQQDRSLEIVLVNGPGGTLRHQLVRAFLLTGNDYDVEVWLDAHTGELVNVINQLDEADGTVRGGIYPNTNTAGTEDLRTLSFINVQNGGTKTADASGVYDYAPAGSLATASLSGPFITINDTCGASSVSTSLSPGDLTFGGGGAGTDCVTPGLGGPGNTHAARTAFYHLNLIKEKARQYLDADPATATPWLSANLTTNVNKPGACNAGWSPGSGTLSFFPFTPAGPGGFDCSNTAEIAAVFLHEFGHGLDQNTNGSAPESASREAYGDTMAFLQTHDSCIGQNFSPGHVCQDGCTTCTGVRDVNPALNVTPANITSSPINCTSGLVWFDGSVISRTCSMFGGGVLGYEGHCEGQIAAGAVWDMAQGFVSRYGDGAGWALADRVWYESVYDTASAYQIVSGGKCNILANVDGCGANNWYTVMLAVDDDNGNLADGTPDADLIWNAFNGHGIACGASAPPVFTTCMVPPATPVLTATAGSGQVDLSWGTIAGATSYKIFRNEIACGAGYTPIAEVAAPMTTYTDTAVANAVSYYYRLQVVGASDTCLSQFSSCQTATPVAPLTPANIFMVLDQSGSMSEPTTAAGESKIDALHDAGAMVIDLVDDYASAGFRLGAVSFSTAVTGTSTLKDLSVAAQKTALQSFVSGLTPTNSTAIGLGVNGAVSAFPASPNQKVVMLLSDGIQNVPPNLELKAPPPGAAVGGMALPSDVQFFTVALGDNIQEDLFDDLATTGGIPGFYYSGGTAEIQSNFAFWIAGVLGLDPAGAFAPGGFTSAIAAPPSGGDGVHYHVNKTVRRVTFLVTWAAKGTDVRFELITPAGTIHPPASSFHPAHGYAEYTVQLPLQGHGPADHVGEWIVHITNSQLPVRTYALFDDPVLNLKYTTGGADPGAGEPLPLEAQVFENGRAISGLTIQATLDGPGVGLGEALSASNAQPAKPSGDPADAAALKLAALLALDPNALGRSANSVTLTEASPGIYRASLPASQTGAAGTYVVNFRVTGSGVTNGVFERTQRFSRYLRLKPVSSNTSVLAELRGEALSLRFTPRDRNNFRLGPGWGSYVNVASSSGSVAPIIDNLDGSYSTKVNGVTTSDPNVTITVRGETVADAPVSHFKAASSGRRLTAGPFIGYTFFDSALPIKDGPVVGGRWTLGLNPRLAFESEAGATFTKDQLHNDGVAVQLLQNVSWNLLAHPTQFRPFILGGVGALLFEGFTQNDAGLVWVLGGGVAAPVTGPFEWRIDARDLIARRVYGSGTTHNFQVTFGVSATLP